MGKDNAFKVISPIKRMLLNVFITVETALIYRPRSSNRIVGFPYPTPPHAQRYESLKTKWGLFTRLRISYIILNHP